MTSMPPHAPNVRPAEDAVDDGIDLLEIATVLASHWRLLIIAPVVAGALAIGASYLIAPTFTARTTFLPPQQQQSAAATALASLGALSGLAGSSGIKTPGDQYVALMQSANVEDRIVDRFKLLEVYDVKYRFLARQTLKQNVRITLGKKDGLITAEVDAHDPTMAADIANQYVAELRRLSAELALTEAQQRRVFFENELKRTRAKLTDAQQALQSSGFNAGALKAEPKAAAESYARLQAQIAAAEVQLQVVRRALSDTAPEVQQQLVQLSALRSQLLKLEGSATAPSDADYVSHYREFKYQETLFDLFSKQFEMARLDESREGALIQVVDAATPPERKSKPARAIIAIATAAAAFLLLVVWVLVRHSIRTTSKHPHAAEKFARLRAALKTGRSSGT
ncbi:Wzz/FepE/Etk N-terminal domain-containing protein [Roseateles violae]|uniref:Wzz/FepE/Etk N-terminal domain-containing protein n=1 Tax=Roseateles violae TaxID=3058042 RepID=A0ABT8DSI4_9BURK|nr:Wzz/FepE/Etk N-terminal domain-containing protein [Pelomonas sp. PFR6]MDN3920943.1 Wzz/FepE/Etk N-terminal domain-containing protein [Pelomonas sp. PFR6]